MSQAIPGFTPQMSSYQGNFQQQQVSAALASSSSGMPGDSIALIAAGVVTGCSLLTLGTILAVKHFSTSGDKPKPAQTTSLRSTEKTLLPQPISPPQSTQQSQYITLPGFPGFIDPADGIYRERGGPCGRSAYRTVRYAFGMKPITDEKFEEQVPNVLNRGTLAIDLYDLADRDGFDVRVHFPAEFGRAGIGNTRAFIVWLKLASPLKPHCVAMVYSEAKKNFCLSDNADQDRAAGEIYSGSASEALLEYLRSNNFTADAVDAVLTFHERVPAHGVEPQRPPLPLR